MQGFGNAGAIIDGLLLKAGYKVVAVSDSKGGICRREGLDIPSVRQFKDSTRNLKAVYFEDTVCSIVEHETITNEGIARPRRRSPNPRGLGEPDHRGQSLRH